MFMFISTSVINIYSVLLVAKGFKELIIIITYVLIILIHLWMKSNPGPENSFIFFLNTSFVTSSGRKLFLGLSYCLPIVCLKI